MATKFCHACQTDKPVSEFHRNKVAKDGYQTQCKRCLYQAQRKWLKAHPKKKEQYRTREREADQERYHTDAEYRKKKLANARKWRNGNLGRVKKRSKAEYVRFTYGLSRNGYLLLRIKCGGLCSCCRKDRPLVVDHCHATDTVRGLLCKACNHAIGQLGDNVAGLQQAIAYLKQATGADHDKTEPLTFIA